MVKRLGTYRVEVDLLAAAAAAATVRGESVTDVIIRALETYIRGASAGNPVFAPPVDAPPVYTDVECPASYVEPTADPPCKHPADAVDGTECRACGADVW